MGASVAWESHQLNVAKQMASCKPEQAVPMVERGAPGCSPCWADAFHSLGPRGPHQYLHGCHHLPGRGPCARSVQVDCT